MEKLKNTLKEYLDSFKKLDEKDIKSKGKYICSRLHYDAWDICYHNKSDVKYFYDYTFNNILLRKKLNVYVVGDYNY